jgi:hypothetical protein
MKTEKELRTEIEQIQAQANIEIGKRLGMIEMLGEIKKEKEKPEKK